MEPRKEIIAGKRSGERILILGIAVVMLLIFSYLCGKGKETGAGSIEELTRGWYLLEEGARVEVSLPAEFETGEDAGLILYNDSLTQKDAGKTITTMGALYELKAVMGTETLYQYSDEYFPRNDQMKAKIKCDIILPLKWNDDTLELTYTKGNGHYQIGTIYIGDSRAVQRSHYVNAAFTLGITFAMALMAILAMGISVYLKHVQLYDPRFMNVAWFLLVCGTWCFTDSSLVQSSGYVTPLICTISFYAFMLLAVPMLHFVRNTGGMEKYRILDWLIYAYYINAIIQGLLNYFHVFEFVQMLFVTHLLLVIGVAVSVYLLVWEYREKRSREIHTILWAFLMVSLGGVLSLLQYWLLEIPFYELLFEFGILIFVFLILGGVVITMADNIRFKTEMTVYQRLALEDRLTGMKNRRAFEEYLVEIQKNADTYENVALIFMDLNQLKYINDNFGHNTGDEALIASARCVENAFGSEGNCYRIGGDEFCTVLLNPKKSEAECFRALDQEIQQYNQSSRYRISIARGLSYLRDENGKLKTISDWKYEADLNMYKNKGRIKRL